MKFDHLIFLFTYIALMIRSYNDDVNVRTEWKSRIYMSLNNFDFIISCKIEHFYLAKFNLFIQLMISKSKRADYISVIFNW